MSHKLLLHIPVSVLATLPFGAQADAQAGSASLPEPTARLFHQDVAWSPDGRWIAFSQYNKDADAKSGTWSIYLIGSDGSQQRKLVDNATFVTWSPDGKRLAFNTERDGNWDIYTIATDGTGERRITDHEAEDRHPAWSPVGGRIAFTSARDGAKSIYTMASDGSDVKRLTHSEHSDFNPAWSPDGRHIVFFREKGDRKDQIYVVGADGTGERRVTGGTRHNTFPSFLPDGSIAFSCMDANNAKRLVRVDPSGGGRTEIGDVPAFFARWSPDGRRIAFIAGRWPKSAIYTMNAEGTSIRKLVN